MLTRLKHIRTAKKKLADGTIATYYYHRRTNKRIHGEPGTEEFIKNYYQASKSAREIREGTVEGLIETFKASTIFSQFRPRTRQDYDKHFLKIIDKWGDMPLEVLDDSRIRKDLLKWRDELAKSSLRQADYIWATFRRVVQFGIDNAMLGNNYLARPKRLYKSNRRDKIWLPEHVSAFMSHANIEMQTAMVLALHTGQRKGDLIRLTWNAYENNGISLRQSKTGKSLFIPATQTLKNILDNLPRRAVTILTTTKGLPWRVQGFDTAWKRAANKAGIEDLTFHDLRGTAVTVLAEMECSHGQIASITGHSLQYVETILDTYMSRTKKMAFDAIARLEQSWISDIGR